MDQAAVSIIVPCYNMEKYLPDCLESILRQRLKNIEVICINDGSQDETPAILDWASCCDSRVKVIHQENRGVAASRNRGMMAATGKYVAFMDPDDFYPDDGVLELLFRKAEDNDARICGGSFSNYNHPKENVTVCYTGDYAGYTFLKEGFVPYVQYQYDFGYHRFIYDLAFLREHRIEFPPYARFQDPPFFVRAMLAAGEFYAVPDVVYRYRVGFQDKPTSWPDQKLHDMMNGHIDVLNLAAQSGLADLHGLTVRRFESDMVYEPVMKSMADHNEITKELVYEFNRCIDTALLEKSMPGSTKNGAYMIRQFRDPETDTSGVMQLVRKKVKTVGTFYRRNGLRRTMRLLYEMFLK